MVRKVRIVAHVGRETRGRLKLAWIKAIKKDVIIANLTIKMTLNRAEWKKRIGAGNPKVLG